VRLAIAMPLSLNRLSIPGIVHFFRERMIREGTNLDEELTTRPIAGVDWTVDTALIYHKVRHPKTVPILVKRLMKQLRSG
jgi:hypothetical protein